MKNSLYLFFLLLAMAGSVFAQPAASPSDAASDGPQIAFEETEHDFGDITQGETVEHVFAYKNTGNAPLVLNNVLTTCGCTAPQWPKTPIAPGEESQIKVRFNSAGKMGRQNKVITVQSNVEGGATRLKIITMVLPKKTEEAN